MRALLLCVLVLACWAREDASNENDTMSILEVSETPKAAGIHNRARKPRTDPMVNVKVKTHPKKATISFPLLHLTMKTKKGINSVAQVSPTKTAVGRKVRTEAHRLKAKRKKSDKSTFNQFPLLNKVLANTGKPFGKLRTSSVSRGAAPSSKQSMSVTKKAAATVAALNTRVLNKVSKAQRTWTRLTKEQAKSERQIHEANRRSKRQYAKKMKAAGKDAWRRIHKTVKLFNSQFGLRQGRSQSDIAKAKAEFNARIGSKLPKHAQGDVVALDEE